MGEPIRSFQEYESKGIIDVYPSVHVYYSEDDKLEAVELFGNNTSLSIDSIPVFPGKLSDARRILPDLKECYGSFVSKTNSVGIGADGDTIVSILAGCRNYYK